MTPITITGVRERRYRAEKLPWMGSWVGWAIRPWIGSVLEPIIGPRPSRRNWHLPPGIRKPVGIEAGASGIGSQQARQPAKQQIRQSALRPWGFAGRDADRPGTSFTRRFVAKRLEPRHWDGEIQRGVAVRLHHGRVIPQNGLPRLPRGQSTKNLGYEFQTLPEASRQSYIRVKSLLIMKGLRWQRRLE